MASQSFPARFHLRRSGDFRRIYQQRCTASDRWLLVFGGENGLSHPRLGLSVSRKVGPAVSRNRWKRRLREAFRLQQDRLPTGLDLVIVPRSEPEFPILCESLLRLSQQVARKVRRAVL